MTILLVTLPAVGTAAGPSTPRPPDATPNAEPPAAAPEATPDDPRPSDLAASEVDASAPEPDASDADAPDEPDSDDTEADPDDTEADPEPTEGQDDDSTSIEVDLADPMGPIDAVLDELVTQGFSVRDRQRTSTALQGEILTATVRGEQTELLRYMLEQVAEDGYQILLEPTAPDTFQVVAFRARSGQPRGVALVGVDAVVIQGEFRKGENEETVRKLVDLPEGGVVPASIAEQLRTIGYRGEFEVTGAGELLLTVKPGRAIRRIRVRGHIPLPEREIRRVLSPQARPGALARGECVSKKELRQFAPASVCSPEDLACRRWEKDEIARIERHLFDQGYLRGRARLGLACGRNPGEADLWVMLEKGRAFRVKNMKITGNLTTQDQRWIRRVFRPTVAPFLPIPKRVTRKHIEDAKERVAAEYAQPRTGPSSRARRQLELPYPGVRVETNLDRMRPGDVPESWTHLPLEVDVQLGTGVKTAFFHNERIGENRLRSKLQIFKRREPATAAAAVREAENLRNFYQSRGFMLAEVEGRFEDFGTLRRLTFVIDEGPRVRIRDIMFELPDSIPSAVRSDIMRTYRRKRELEPRGRFTDAGARSDLATVLTALAERGYLCATAQVRVGFWPEAINDGGQYAVLDPTTALEAAGEPRWLERQLDPGGLQALRQRKNAGVYVRFVIEPGPRVLTSPTEQVHYLDIPIPPGREIGNLPSSSHGAWGTPRILRDGPLRRRGDERAGGIPLNLTRDREVERDIQRRYNRSGFPLADAEVRWVYRDAAGNVHRVAQPERLTDPGVGLCRENAWAKAVTVDTELYVYEGRRGSFGTTLVRGNFKTRPYVLRREVEWEDGEIYDRGKVDKTRKDIEKTGVVESVQIREQPSNCELTDDPDQPCVVHEIVSITESKDRFMDLRWGFGIATLDPFYVFVRPTFPNMGGTGWDLQLDGHYGANFEALRDQICSGEDCYERSGRMSLRRQRIFASPLEFDITGQIQRRVTPARGQIDSALGQVRLTWPITSKWSVFTGYLIQAANISKGVVKPTLGADLGCGPGGMASCRPPNRAEAIVPDLTGAYQTGVQWQRVDNVFNPDEGFIATGEALLASPYLGGNDWWVRFEFSWQHFVPIPRTNGRLDFRYRLFYGHAIPLPNAPGAHTTSIPEVWRYFGGGTAELGLRGIEPQTMLVDIEEIEGPYGVTTLRPIAQGGHIQALGTFALQFTSVRDFLGGELAHSLFLDTGVLTQRWRDVVPMRDIRRSVGINFIKWDIDIVTVSLGYAVLVPNWIIPRNVRPTDDKNGRFVFDVGATF